MVASLRIGLLRSRYPIAGITTCGFVVYGVRGTAYAGGVESLG
jgi:hypothetical protein